MDYGKLSIDEIKKGYCFDTEHEAYVCNYCGKTFSQSQVFPVGDAFFLAEQAMRVHIREEHEGSFRQNLQGGEKYNTFTDTQKELLTLFKQGCSDKEVAAKLGIAASTVRHQKFTFREKAKQAKYYLAVYEEALNGKTHAFSSDDIISVPNTVTMMDDRYVMTEKEKEQILGTTFESIDPLILKEYPLKAKRQVAVLSRIAEEFEFGKRYSETEVSDILGSIYSDHSILRRHLVDYGFMGRTSDGAEYWLN